MRELILSQFEAAIGFIPPLPPPVIPPQMRQLIPYADVLGVLLGLVLGIVLSIVCMSLLTIAIVRAVRRHKTHES
jgi:hypothetical protein